MTTLIVGLIGQKFSGKSTFVKIAREVAPHLAISHLKNSDILTAMLREGSIPITNINLHKVANFMRQEFGDHSLANAMKERVGRELKQNTQGIIFLDGLRWDADIELLRSYTLNRLVYITTDDLDQLVKRAHNRRERPDEAGMSTAILAKLRMNSTEADIARLGAQADYTIPNNRSEADFYLAVSALMQEILQVRMQAFSTMITPLDTPLPWRRGSTF